MAAFSCSFSLKDYAAETAQRKGRLRKAEASDAGNVVVLACARTPR
jgi:hypothetical protein